jgi:hypothetical protein
MNNIEVLGDVLHQNEDNIIEQIFEKCTILKGIK